MARRELTLETARKKWARQSANPALSLGDRIRLIHQASMEAEQLRTCSTGVAEKTIRLAFSEIFTDPVRGKKVGSVAVHRYMRFHRLSPEVVDLMAKHAAGDSGHLIGLSYALELAEVGDQQMQLQLLKSAINEKWGVRTLKKKSHPFRDIPSVQKEARHMVVIGKIEAAAVGLSNELKGLMQTATFLDTVDTSPYRSAAESIELVQRINHAHALLTQLVQTVPRVSNTLALAAEKVVESKH